MKKRISTIMFMLLACTVFSQDYIFNLEDVDDIRTSSINFVAKDIIRTQGYYLPNDGGSALYIVESNSSLLDNGSDIIRISTNYIARLVKNQLINVKQFGAKGDLNFNSTQYLQNAIDFCIDNWISDLHIPEGIFRVSQSLVIANKSNGFSNVDTRPAGINLIGKGTNHTIFRSWSGHTGPMIKVQGLANNGSNFISSTYINGGSIKGIEFQGVAQGGVNNHGIEILAWWNANIKDCKISGFNGDGIRVISDVSVDSNPDFSASVNGKFENLIIERNKGYGFNDNGSILNPGTQNEKVIGQGSPHAIFEHCIFILNEKGGAFIQSSAMSFTSCSIAANGWYSEIVPNSNVGYGLFYAGSNSTFNGRHIVQNCEFDNNKTAHIAINSMSNSRFIGNRFIHDDRNTSEINPSNVSVIFDPNLDREVIKNVEFKSNFFRTVNKGEFPALTLFDWKTTDNVSHIYIENNSYTDNTLAPVTKVSLTTFNNYMHGNHHLKNNYVLKDNNFVPSKKVTSYGTPPPFYLGSIQSNTYPSGSPGGVMYPLSFNQPDHYVFHSSAPQNSFLENIHYNTSNGVFTCPETGMYRLDVQVTLRDILSNQKAMLHVKKNGNMLTADYVWGTSNVRTNLDISTKFFARKGDEIHLEIGHTGSNLLVIEPLQYGFNRLNIEFVK